MIQNEMTESEEMISVDESVERLVRDEKKRDMQNKFDNEMRTHSCEQSKLCSSLSGKIKGSEID
jgi:hypothetical protein